MLVYNGLEMEIVTRKITKLLSNHKRLTSHEIAKTTHLTLEGVNKYLRQSFKKEVVVTGKIVSGFTWTDKGLQPKDFKEKITYWSLK